MKASTVNYLYPFWFAGKETEVVKSMYESELREARDLYNDTEKEKARIELKIQSLEDQVAEYRRK